jgi:hypothetical protein
MPHRGSIAKEDGSTVTGGTVAGILCVGAYEAAHYGRKSESILGTTCSTKAEQFPLG